jgi:hypothetical protein
MLGVVGILGFFPATVGPGFVATARPVELAGPAAADH